MKRLLKRCDRYGEPITVKYQGERDYRTLCGACMSVAVALIVLFFAFVQGQRLVLREDPRTSTSVDF